MVDGGKPQVNAAARALAELGIDDVYVVGLAKRLEEVWLPDSDFPVILPRTSQGLYLLQRIRDEAHRFAITFHRQKRGKAMTVSAWTACPGWGSPSARPCWPTSDPSRDEGRDGGGAHRRQGHRSGAGRAIVRHFGADGAEAAGEPFRP